MSTDATQGDARAYRRGKVIGLTVAGVLLLIAFALLFLFTRWQVEKDERTGDLAQLQSLPPAARAAIVAAASNGELDAVIEAKKQGIDILLLVRSGTAGDAERLRQLIPAGERDRMLDALTRLPEPDRRKLIDVVAVDDVDGLLANLSLVAELTTDGRTPAELHKAVEVWEALGPAITPSDIREALALRARLGDRLTLAEDRRSEIAASLDANLGNLVRSLNGRIEPSGAIVLPNPDGVLFSKGDSEITQDLRAFLRQACQPWIETLYGFGNYIGEIRIEGHASSEWTEASSPEEAFLLNLGLSQERAQAVLAFCLELELDKGIRAWARGHLVAIGYSSSRPVMVDDVEAAPQSRRVVFNFDVSNDRLIEDLGRDLKSGVPSATTEAGGGSLGLPAPIEGSP